MNENTLLPPANGVWDKVIFSKACVSHSVHRECLCMIILPVWLPGPMFLHGVSVPGPMFLRGGLPPGGLNLGGSAGATHPTRIHTCLETVTVALKYSEKDLRGVPLYFIFKGSVQGNFQRYEFLKKKFL